MEPPKEMNMHEAYKFINNSGALSYDNMGATIGALTS